MSISLPDISAPACFEEIYSELELTRAALQVYTKPLFAWRKALSQSHDGQTLYDFARNTPLNLARLHNQLGRQDFSFRPAVAVEYNFNGRHRTIYVFPWEERIVDRFLYDTLNRHFDPLFSINSYAYRCRGFGLDPCQRRIRRLINSSPRPLYFLKRDVRQFFPSVNHQRMLDLLKQWIAPDNYLFDLLQQRVCFQVQHMDETSPVKRGIPFGSAVSCFLANIYLTPLDCAIEQIPEVTYFRYADDMLLASPSREALVVAKEKINEVLVSLHLQSKEKAHLDFVFHPDGKSDSQFQSVRKFRHLGLEFRDDGSVGLSRDKARKIRNLFRFAFRRYRRKLQRLSDPIQRAELAVKISRNVIDRGARSVAIIDYYLKHVDDEEQLRLIDRWLAEEVLSVAFQNGHRKGNFRGISFSQLREMGLPSLRHRRRLLRHGQLESPFFQLRTERIVEQERRRRLSGRKAFSPGLEAVAQ
jgi:retron-type reverse transcriptase